MDDKIDEVEPFMKLMVACANQKKRHWFSAACHVERNRCRESEPHAALTIHKALHLVSTDIFSCLYLDKKGLYPFLKPCKGG